MVEQRHLAAGAVVVLDRHGRFRGHGNGPSFGGTACVSGVAAAPASLSLSPSDPSGGGAVAGIIGGLSSDSMRGNSRMNASFRSEEPTSELKSLMRRS